MVIKLVQQLPAVHRTGLAVASLLLGATVLLPSESVEASRHHSPQVLELGVAYPLSLTLESRVPEWNETSDLTWQRLEVKRGDTLAKIFQRQGFSARDTHEVTHAGELAKTLVTLLPGDELYLSANAAGQLQALKYVLSATDTLFMQRVAEDNGWHALIEQREVSTSQQFTQGEITSNFWNAGVAAGLTDAQIMNLAGIFGWDIDFAMEIRSGDSFNVVFEERYVDGEFIGYGDILAAEFTNQGETFTAIRHRDGNYYTPDGRSMRKSFLRAPVNFKYVSSNFTNKRFHPVQKRWKAHRGTDYVAAVGTPILAAGDGKVIKAGYDKYNGNYVFIQHGEKYTTKYLHLHKRKVNQGQSVKQGQTIGTLGATGMVTGAHLHYEFLVDGTHRNPRTVTLPKALPIDKKEKAAFEQIAAARMEQLNTSRRIMLAMR